MNDQQLAQDPVFQEILTQLRPHAGPDAVIQANTVITRDLGMDSLAIMDFVFDLEDALDISIPMERIAEVQTIADLVVAVKKLQEEA